MENLSNLTHAQLIEHLFGRIETLEGHLRAYRAIVPAGICAFAPEQRERFNLILGYLQADAITKATLPAGDYLRGASVLAANQTNGLKSELNLIQSAVREFAATQFPPSPRE